MRELLLTPETNVNYKRHQLVSEEPKLFYKLIVDNNEIVDIYDTIDNIDKKINISNISLYNYRIYFANKKYYICSMLSRS